MSEYGGVRTTRADIEDRVFQTFGLGLNRWMLDLAATARGRNGQLLIAAEDIAARLSVRITDQVPAGSLGASRVSDSDRAEVGVAPELSFPERNFTIAHELGHIFLDRASSGTWRRGVDVEDVCDLLAAYLLAPITFVDTFLRTHGARLASLQELSDICQIPRKGIERLVVEHYPLSIWQKRLGMVNGTGNFDLGPFEETISMLLDEATSTTTAKVVRRVAGINEWMVEALPSDEGGYGLLKPTGLNVRTAPVVRAINVPRNSLLEAEPGEWAAVRSNPDRSTR